MKATLRPSDSRLLSRKRPTGATTRDGRPEQSSASAKLFLAENTEAREELQGLCPACLPGACPEVQEQRTWV